VKAASEIIKNKLDIEENTYFKKKKKSPRRKKKKDKQNGVGYSSSTVVDPP